MKSVIATALGFMFLALVSLFLALSATPQTDISVAKTLNAPQRHTMPATATITPSALFRMKYDVVTKQLQFQKLGALSEVDATFAIYQSNGVATPYSGPVTYQTVYSISDVEVGSIFILSGKRFELSGSYDTSFTAIEGQIK